MVKTIILLGGRATRMRPLSVDKDKSMISFMGKPLLSYLIEDLKLCGLSDIMLTSSGKNGEIKDYFSDGKKFGVSIEYYDGEFYGTAGTVKIIDEMRDSFSETLMVIYGDNLLKADFDKMVRFHLETESSCTVLYHRPKFESFLYEYHDKSFNEDGERTNYGVMDIDSDNRITNVVEKPLLAEIKNFTNPVANAAVYLIKKEILDFVPSNSPFDFPKDLFPLLIKKGMPCSCFGFSIGEGYRIDIGTIPHYYNTHLAILEGKVDFDIHFPLLEERFWVGSNSTIGPGSNIGRPVLICENSRIGSNTNIECSIIGNSVEIGRGSFIRKSIILDNVHLGSGVRISHSIIGENCFIEDGVSLPANTVLGNYCRLGGTQLAMREKDFLGLIRG